MAKLNRGDLVILFLCSALFVKVNSLSFTLAAGSKKCLREEVHKDILVTGEYKLSEAPIKTHLTVSCLGLSHVNQDEREKKLVFLIQR